MNAKRADPILFQQQVQAICDAYAEAMKCYHEQGLHTVCLDEQTGIQALERIAPDKWPRPGQIAKREYEYKRHGTTVLFGNLHVATGKLLCPMLHSTRKEKDFLKNIDNLVQTDFHAIWRFITDNLNTHLSESLVRYVAKQCQITEDLGKKGKHGILKSVATRRTFLTNQQHRIHFIYTPTHTSWLNQIEIWFGVLRSKVTRLGNFYSIEDLEDKIARFIEYYNETMAHPYQWTYAGKPLCV